MDIVLIISLVISLVSLYNEENNVSVFLACQLNLSAEMSVVTSTQRPKFYKRPYAQLFWWRFVIWPSYNGNLSCSWKNDLQLFTLGEQNDSKSEMFDSRRLSFLCPPLKSRFAKKKPPKKPKPRQS